MRAGGRRHICGARARGRATSGRRFVAVTAALERRHFLLEVRQGQGECRRAAVAILVERRLPLRWLGIERRHFSLEVRQGQGEGRRAAVAFLVERQLPLRWLGRRKGASLGDGLLRGGTVVGGGGTGFPLRLFFCQG